MLRSFESFTQFQSSKLFQGLWASYQAAPPLRNLAAFRSDILSSFRATLDSSLGTPPSRAVWGRVGILIEFAGNRATRCGMWNREGHFDPRFAEPSAVSLRTNA